MGVGTAVHSLSLTLTERGAIARRSTRMGLRIKSSFLLGVRKSTRTPGERVSAGDPSPREQGL